MNMNLVSTGGGLDEFAFGYGDDQRVSGREIATAEK